MKNKKSAVWTAYILTAVIFGLLINGWLNVGQASQAKEHIKVGSRDIILNDKGDSEANKSNLRAGKSSSAASQSLMSSLKGFFGLGDKTIALAFTCVSDKVLFDRIIPDFQNYWLTKTGKKVNFVTGYALPDFDKMATSVSGKPVQIILMSSSTNTISRGYTNTKWQETPNKGVVLSYPQVFLVRKGNPKIIKTYADLTIPGIRVIHVNPLRGTGGGLWQVYGIYGSALKETELATGNKDRKAATERLQKTEENAFYEAVETAVAVKYFLQGAGDVLIISEAAALKAVKKNDSIELVVPPYTVINDLAIYKMERNISSSDQPVIDEFIDYLFTEQSQQAIAEYGFRPSDPTVLARHPEFKLLDNPFQLAYLGEQTAIKRDVILDKWLKINNNRTSKANGNGLSQQP
ncbi:MAG: substrate-binding domain-containing protein [Carboxydocellales bacterium]